MKITINRLLFISVLLLVGLAGCGGGGGSSSSETTTPTSTTGSPVDKTNPESAGQTVAPTMELLVINEPSPEHKPAGLLKSAPNVRACPSWEEVRLYHDNGYMAAFTRATGDYYYSAAMEYGSEVNTYEGKSISGSHTIGLAGVVTIKREEESCSYMYAEPSGANNVYQRSTLVTYGGYTVAASVDNFDNCPAVSEVYVSVDSGSESATLYIDGVVDSSIPMDQDLVHYLSDNIEFIADTTKEHTPFQLTVSMPGIGCEFTGELD